ncbi:unnamed protein product [Bursaphelenchus xylophilus]|uniref:(pine wood nematode) hypothetical protein n=1 Tax=Bursaphelenchus xylophilus TaxID=6326 RepID=A0A1I7RZH7_BURXY|nr:unnamed protein product [Bursaphelenchus xylophilus]CAG9106368.1 unnamed protein product [Bursaphelenchus xylophilus]
MLYIVLILGVATAGAVKYDKPERTIETVLRTPHNEFFNLPDNSSMETVFINQQVYNETSRSVEEIRLRHRAGVAQALRKGFELVGDGAGLVITNGGITYEQLISLVNVFTTRFFHSVDDRYIQAAGNLLLRSAAVGHVKVSEKVHKYFRNNADGQIKFPKPCNISDEEFETISIAGAILQVFHELFPSNPSPGLEGEINEKLFTFGKFEGYSIFTNCGRESYGDYEKIFLTEDSDESDSSEEIKDVFKVALARTFF